MKEIQEMLFALQDAVYGDFQAKLTPGIPRERFIGVRVPVLRKLAKELKQDPKAAEFLEELPHEYYDEDILHALLLSGISEYSSCLEQVERFLPYIDNWAVCDILSPAVFRRHRGALLGKVREWSASSHTYTCRFGMGMLMSHFLDEDFEAELLKIPASVKSGEYYVNMMIAWFFATALAKQWDSTIPYLTGGTLDRWVRNKTIQKAIESYRITPEQKIYLRTLKK